MLAKLKIDHAEIRLMAEGLCALLNNESLPDLKILAKARWEMSSKVMQVMAYGDRHILSKMLNDDRPHILAMAKEHQADMQALFGVFTQSAQHWTTDRIQTDWAGFRVAGLLNIENTLRQMQKVEDQLGPLVDDGVIDDSEPSPPSVNWTRDAFAIKDVITGKAVSKG